MEDRGCDKTIETGNTGNRELIVDSSNRLLPQFIQTINYQLSTINYLILNASLSSSSGK
jgi:hypothetical protein